MGYELWASPITGYRRHGTRLEDFNAVLGERIKIKDIFEPLKCCQADAPADEMGEALRFYDFDLAGVRKTKDGPVVGFVTRGSLNFGSVADHLIGLDEATIISSEGTIRELMLALERAPFVFVSSDGDLNAIATRADLNKPMVRVYLFGLISLLEIHLSFWISRIFASERWEEMLTPGRIDLARSIQRQRAQKGQNLSLLQCLQLCDKRTLIADSMELRNLLQLGSKRSTERLLRSVEDLRNSIAHSQYDLVSGGSWEELITLAASIQETVALSDQLVEKRAVELSSNHESTLW